MRPLYIPLLAVSLAAPSWSSGSTPVKTIDEYFSEATPVTIDGKAVPVRIDVPEWVNPSKRASLEGLRAAAEGGAPNVQALEDEIVILKRHYRNFTVWNRTPSLLSDIFAADSTPQKKATNDILTEMALYVKAPLISQLRLAAGIDRDPSEDSLDGYCRRYPKRCVVA